MLTLVSTIQLAQHSYTGEARMAGMGFVATFLEKPPPTLIFPGSLVLSNARKELTSIYLYIVIDMNKLLYSVCINLRIFTSYSKFLVADLLADLMERLQGYNGWIKERSAGNVT
jgi:hypothetical protein